MVPKSIHSQPLGPLARTNILDLTIGLRLADPVALKKFVTDVYDPESPVYRHFLTSEEFTKQFGPAPEDYEAVITLARTSHLQIVGKHANRMLLNVRGSVADIERAFQVRLSSYQDAKQNRTFHAPDAEPSVPGEVTILEVGGLNNYEVPSPMDLQVRSIPAQTETPYSGTGLSGTFIGSDFRNAYARDVALTGAGQKLALVEFDGYYARDIATYEKKAGLPSVPLRNVLINGFDGKPGKNSVEDSLDIEMAVSMAPGLSEVIVYEAPPAANSANDLLNRIAVDNSAKQISCSWRTHLWPSAVADQIFQQFAAQGQSFFQASGDSGAYAGPAPQPSDNPYVTSVGGTSLWTVDWLSGLWAGEAAWNVGNGTNSTGGGISAAYSIPTWQRNFDMSANQGSTTMRNVPDVAMIADNIYIVCRNGTQGSIGGTSASAPLWAAFTALINEQAASNGLQSIGFINPALYAVAQGANYTADFHDITSGDNTTVASPNAFHAVSGYDLCTGLGTPNGQSLIDDLTTTRSSIKLLPSEGFIAAGPTGGPFDVTNKSFKVWASGWQSAAWSIINTSLWLDVSVPTGMAYPSGSNTEVMVSLNTKATQLAPGNYTTTMLLSNLTDGVVQSRDFALQVIARSALTLTLSPDQAVTEGARWQVDNFGWQTNGAVVDGLEVGSHQIVFSNFSTWWKPPEPQTVVMGAEDKMVLTGAYTQLGALQKNLGPIEAVNAGARWRADGGPWQQSGETTFLENGNHLVEFLSPAGWSITNAETVVIAAGGTIISSNRFAPVGNLNVVLPGTESFYRVEWAVDGDGGHYSGETITGLSVGPHIVTFPTSIWLDYWLNAPAPQTVIIGTNTTTFITGIYTRKTGFVQVVITPTNAVNGGTWWKLDNGDWQTSGASVSCTAGNYHNLFFASVGKWAAPDMQVIQIGAGTTNIIKALYTDAYQFTTIAGQDGVSGASDGSSSAAQFNSPSGIAVSSDGNVFVADAGSSTIRQLHLNGTNWEVSTIAGVAGEKGDADGVGTVARFDSPTGIAVSTNGQLYIADHGNCTIRRLTLVGTNWVADTIAGLAATCGNADGYGTNARFNAPIGIALDPAGNVFIADAGNYTIRKLTSDGSNYLATTIAGKGYPWASDGLGLDAGFEGLQGIACDTSGNLFVTDSRVVRKLTAVGTNYMVSTAAGNQFSPDSIFSNLSGLLPDTNGCLYVVDSNQIRKLTPDGTGCQITSIGGPQRYGPKGMAADAAGHIFLADATGQTIRMGAPGLLGTLQVTFSPAAAAMGILLWQVDGGPWQIDGAAVPNLDVGIHTVTFSGGPIQEIVVTTNSITQLTGGYQVGSIQVSLYPAEAVSAGAQWRVDEGPWQDTAASVSDLPVGYHTVTFSLDGHWVLPSPQIVKVNENVTTAVTGNFIPVGSLQIMIQPIETVNLGGEWRINNGPWLPSGTEIFLNPGTYTVDFTDVKGWVRPGVRYFTITGAEKVVEKISYATRGALQVTIIPAAATNAGPRWRVDGGPWQVTGATVSGLVAGPHIVDFSTVEGWIAPSGQSMVVNGNQTTTNTALYLQQFGALKVVLRPPEAIEAGVQWRVDGGTWQDSGAIVSDLVLEKHAVDFKEVPNWRAPSSGTVTIKPATNTINVSYAAAGTGSPTLIITTPATNEWHFPDLTVTGTATGMVAVAKVYCQINGGEWRLAHGRKNWASTVTLLPGTNTIRAYAENVNGWTSETNSIKARFAPVSRVPVTVTGLGTLAPNLNERLLVIGTTYTVRAVAGRGYLFSDWSGTVTSKKSTLTFVMQTNTVLQAHFVPNPFPSVAGIYNGLFYSDPVSEESSGFASIRVMTNQAFSGRILLDGATNILAGAFDVNGMAQLTVPRRGKSSLSVALQLDLTNHTDSITGSVSTPDFASQLTAIRAIFNATHPATNFSSDYVVIIDGFTNTSLAPAGYGSGLFSVKTNGGVAFSGTLGDGSRVNAAGPLLKGGVFPFYFPLYRGGGFFAGWANFDRPNVQVNSPFPFWVKKPIPSGKFYKDGFCLFGPSLSMAGVRPNTGASLDYSNGIVYLSDGNLSAPIVSQFNRKTNNAITVTSDKNQLNFSLNAKGLFAGSFLHPVSHAPTLIKGAVTNGFGFGWFLGTNQSGAVLIKPQ